MLDTRHLVETPEGIDIHASLAGPVVRSMAFIIDLLIKLGLNLLISIPFAFAGEVGIAVILLSSFLIQWFYPVYFELFRQGQTPGKKQFNLVVVQRNLGPVTTSSSIIRNLLLFVDFLPVGYLLGIISMSLSQHFQRLGDFAADTLVVELNQNTDHIIDDAIEPIIPPATLNADDKLALVAFTMRKTELSQARQKELAMILTPVHQLKNGDEALHWCNAVGYWLAGKR